MMGRPGQAVTARFARAEVVLRAGAALGSVAIGVLVGLEISVRIGAM